MSKYAPLESFLERSDEAEISLSFKTIEKILDFPLPTSARKYAAWWSNNATGHVNAEAWLSAGFKAAQVDLAEEKLVFIRDNARAKTSADSPLHPIFGCMKGTVTIPEGVDLTEPAMPEWAEIAENARLPE